MSTNSRTLDVCLTPMLIPMFDISKSIVVVIDILRATSSICVALANGVKSIVPVRTIEESISYREKGYLTGAERNGEMLEGFDLGNSPFSYMDPKVAGSRIALTTTNGTQAIHAAAGAAKIVAGSFLNMDLLAKWLNEQEEDVLFLCSGWKNSFNLEDTLFAGAMVNKLKQQYSMTMMQDAAHAAEHLYTIAKDDMFGFLENSSHRKRLEKLNIEKDIAYCLTPNQAPVIPFLADGELINIAR